MMRRRLLIAAGTLFVALGVIGIFVPLLPTTPFLLLSAACYSRSSERFYLWLVHHRYLGEYVRAYRDGHGVPRRARVFSISLLWVTIGYSMFFVVEILWIRVMLLVIAVGVTIHLVAIKTAQRPERLRDRPLPVDLVSSAEKTRR